MFWHEKFKVFLKRPAVEIWWRWYVFFSSRRRSQNVSEKQKQCCQMSNKKWRSCAYHETNCLFSDSTRLEQQSWWQIIIACSSQTDWMFSDPDTGTMIATRILVERPREPLVVIMPGRAPDGPTQWELKTPSFSFENKKNLYFAYGNSESALAGPRCGIREFRVLPWRCSAWPAAVQHVWGVCISLLLHLAFCFAYRSTLYISKSATAIWYSHHALSQSMSHGEGRKGRLFHCCIMQNASCPAGRVLRPMTLVGGALPWW
jgi:hypothetical protein